MIDRRKFISVVALGTLATRQGVRAQQPAKVWRIGVLREGPPGTPPPKFLDALRELGWVVGRNVTFERRFADRVDQLPALAIELVKQEVDIILTDGTPAARAAKEATSTIPIVFNVGADPVERQLVASLGRPGGNLTGFAWGLYDEKLLEVLKEALPRASRVVYPLREPNPKVVSAASALGMRLLPVTVQRPEDLQVFYAALRSAQPEDCEKSRPHDPGITSAARGRSDPINADTGRDNQRSRFVLRR